MEYMKKFAGVAFAVAFIMAIVVFTGVGQNLIPRSIARWLFIGFGGVGILLNLLSFERGKHNPLYSLVYWMATGIIFVGVLFKIQHWPYATEIMLAGVVVLAGSFFIPTSRSENNENSEELLDN